MIPVQTAKIDCLQTAKINYMQTAKIDYVRVAYNVNYTSISVFEWKGEL